MKLLNAKITEISDRGVRVTGYLLKEPTGWNYVNRLGFDTYSYEKSIQEYESSKFEAWVDNAFNKKDAKKAIGRIIPDEWTVELLKDGFNFYPELKVGMPCKVIETKTGCKIVELK